jgi:hypothetical protein
MCDPPDPIRGAPEGTNAIGWAHGASSRFARWEAHEQIQSVKDLTSESQHKIHNQKVALTPKRSEIGSR